jgi:hypothetical protein
VRGGVRTSVRPFFVFFLFGLLVVGCAFVYKTMLLSLKVHYFCNRINTGFVAAWSWSWSL